MADNKEKGDIKSTYIFHDIKFGQTTDKSSMFNAYLYNDMVQFTIAKQDEKTKKFSKKESIYLKGILDNGYAHFFLDLCTRFKALTEGKEVSTDEITIKNRLGTIMLVGGIFSKDGRNAVYIRIKKKENKDSKEFTLNETHYFGGARVIFRKGDPLPTDTDVYLTLETFYKRFDAMASAPDIKASHFREGGFDKNGSEDSGGSKGNNSSSSSGSDDSDSFPFWTLNDEIIIENYEEIWKPIKGFEGKFEVSNLGRVKSLSREVPPTGPNQKVKTVKERILRPITQHPGYYNVSLEGVKHLIHRLVAKAFVNNPDSANFDCVNHKNGIKLDNRCVNLEWCNKLLNNRHAVETGLSYSIKIKIIDTINNIADTQLSKKKTRDKHNISERRLNKHLESGKPYNGLVFKYA